MRMKQIEDQLSRPGKEKDDLLTNLPKPVTGTPTPVEIVGDRRPAAPLTMAQQVSRDADLSRRSTLEGIKDQGLTPTPPGPIFDQFLSCMDAFQQNFSGVFQTGANAVQAAANTLPQKGIEFGTNAASQLTNGAAWVPAPPMPSMQGATSQWQHHRRSTGRTGQYRSVATDRIAGHGWCHQLESKAIFHYIKKNRRQLLWQR